MNRFVPLMLLMASLASAQTVLATIDAPDTNISGLAYGNGSLWAVDGVTRYLYSVDPASGTIQSTTFIAPVAGETPTGLAFGNSLLFIGLTNHRVAAYNQSGVYQYDFTVAC